MMASQLGRLLGAACLVLCGACYAPELRDCTVTCGSATACADDQVCGSDGFCAAPDVAGQCETIGPPMLTLRVMLQGAGNVVVRNVGECESDGTTPGDCTWPITPGAALELLAAGGTATKFDKWTSTTCAGQDSSCMVTAAASTVVVAKFKLEGH